MVACAAFVIETHFAQEKEKKIALQKHHGKKKKILNCSNVKEHKSICVPSVFPNTQQYSPSINEVTESSPVKWLAQGHLQHLGRARLASAQRDSGFNSAMGASRSWQGF